MVGNDLRDREEAGRLLAQQLQGYKNQKNVVVLGLARGGLPVAYEVAAALNAPLNVIILRKLGVQDMRNSLSGPWQVAAPRF